MPEGFPPRSLRRKIELLQIIILILIDIAVVIVMIILTTDVQTLPLGSIILISIPITSIAVVSITNLYVARCTVEVDYHFVNWGRLKQPVQLEQTQMLEAETDSEAKVRIRGIRMPGMIIKRSQYIKSISQSLPLIVKVTRPRDQCPLMICLDLTAANSPIYSFKLSAWLQALWTTSTEIYSKKPAFISDISFLGWRLGSDRASRISLGISFTLLSIQTIFCLAPNMLSSLELVYFDEVD